MLRTISSPRLSPFAFFTSVSRREHRRRHRKDSPGSELVCRSDKDSLSFTRQKQTKRKRERERERSFKRITDRDIAKIHDRKVVVVVGSVPVTVQSLFPVVYFTTMTFYRTLVFSEEWNIVCEAVSMESAALSPASYLSLFFVCSNGFNRHDQFVRLHAS